MAVLRGENGELKCCWYCLKLEINGRENVKEKKRI
jgi:hypothetical protein